MFSISAKKAYITLSIPLNHATIIIHKWWIHQLILGYSIASHTIILFKPQASITHSHIIHGECLDFMHGWIHNRKETLIIMHHRIDKNQWCRYYHVVEQHYQPIYQSLEYDDGVQQMLHQHGVIIRVHLINHMFATWLLLQ